MKTGIWLMCMVFAKIAIHAQGFEKIIVEKYYVSDETDSIISDGKLPVGSTTYRIFVDLKKGFRFQAAYGVPGHPMEISTTTSFYNNEQFGAAIANGILKKNTYKSTTLLDSYLSVVAGSDGNYAVLKISDTTGGINNLDKALHYSDASLSIPLSLADGLQAASPVAEVIFFGIDSLDLDVFRKNSNGQGQSFHVENGSWACLLGSAGADSTNTVLIAQVTTNGKLSFKLNIQIGGPSGEVENYVAENPTGAEIFHSSLLFPVPVTGSKKYAGKKRLNN